ncbi:ABC transporter permease [Streptomyces ureilyticus]|uniref:ABC transporter permease n=1 Tax=Streptomyces ureilyticus TaxID=1775131 RepID=A0ABX0DXA7_9ACTN|nr:ABC transporter permease [Streptomyces ureilyticus]NGO46521.1 ABC transporter permease [Streptomyces ureilyticus]
MSTLTEARPTSVVAAPEPRRWAAVFALARVEARELLLQIPVLFFSLLYVGYLGWQVWTSDREGMNAFPVLQDADRATQMPPMLIAVAMLICANRAVLRSRRRGTDRHFDVLVMEPWRRTVAHALSVVPFAVAVALAVAGQFTWQALKPGAVGHGSYAELAVAPLSVLLLGVLGVLLARLIPSSFAVPLLALGGFVGTTLLTAGVGNPRWMRWLWPVASESQAEPLPSDLLGRPAAWHVLYLVGLTVLLLWLAVLAGGGRARLVKAVAVGSAALTLTGAVAQSAGDSPALREARVRASVTPEKDQTCIRHDRSTYCAFPEWTGRTEDWAGTVRRVQSLAGGAAGGTPLTVRQRVEARDYGLDQASTFDPSRTPGEVTVGTRWGGNRIPEFAVGVASVLVAGDEEAAGQLCDARTVVVMWLALGSAPDPMTSLKNVRLDDSVSGSAIVLAPTHPLSMSAQQTDVVREMLERPRYSITVKVKANWMELTSPKTSTARAAELLDVPVPQGKEEEEDECGA